MAVALPDAATLAARASAMIESADRYQLDFEGLLLSETVRIGHWAEAYDVAVATMVDNMLVDDAREGIGAFLGKRMPEWK